MACLVWPTLAPSGTVPPQNDCVDNLAQPIASGGTNGVASVFAIDVDGDDDVDVLSASGNDDKIAWYESDGGSPPTFVEHTISINADGASSVHAADIDGDGDIDVVSASSNDQKVAWYENNGQEVFIERLISFGNRNAASVYAVDVDGDGDNDVLSASINDDTVTLWENDGAAAPTFTEVTITNFADGAASVFAAEIEPDPDPDDPEDNDDLEVLSASRLDNTIAWYQRVVLTVDDETAVVYIQRVIDSNAFGATAVFALDLDADDDVDVLSASSSDNKISWYRNEGTDPPSFVKVVISASALGASAVFAADLDGDDDPDVISASRFDNKIAWYENLGGGDFGDPTTNQQIVTVDAPGAASVYAIDLNGASGGFNDVIAASSVPGTIASDDMIVWHENGGPPKPLDPADTFIDQHEIEGSSMAPAMLLAVDVDDDDLVDVMTASQVDNTVVWYGNDGAEPPQFAENLISNDAPEPRDLFWADLDGDQLDDVVAALAGNESIAWYKNLDGAGDFGDPDTNRRTIANFTTVDASSVFAIDLDDDGDNDVISASFGDDKIAWYENLDGAGDFGNVTSNQRLLSSTADGAQSVHAIDVDGDGDVDVLSASFNDNSIRWYESNLLDGPGPIERPPEFQTRVITNFAEGAIDVDAADMDNDGDIDVLSASSLDNRITWYEQVPDTVAPQVALLEPGETVVCVGTHTVTDDDVTAGTIVNTATVTATELLGRTVEDSDTLTTSASSLDLSKSSDADGSTGEGDTITYTYDVTNDGTITLLDIGVSDPQPGLSGIDCGSGTAEPQIASLDPGQTSSCTATYVVTADDITTGAIVNIGTASRAAAPPVSDLDELTVTFGSDASIDLIKSSDAVEPLVAGVDITYNYSVTNTGTVNLTQVGVDDPQLGIVGIDCGEIAFNARDISQIDFRARRVLAVDLDADGATDVVTASTADNSITWYQSDLLEDPDDALPPLFTQRPITTSANSARAIAVADLGKSPGGMDALDVIGGFLFGISWYEGFVEERCFGFDATGDFEMDGEELSFMGGAFGRTCTEETMPELDWWFLVDYNGDCLIDGEDLAVLTSVGVWGNVTPEFVDTDPPTKTLCAFTCP